MILKFLIAALLAATFGVITYGQFADCSTGLLQAPTAEMQQDGTFMITSNFLNKYSLPSGGWGYNTIQYGIYVSFWERIEIGYVCTVFNDNWKGSQTRTEVTVINQDRHFVGRVCLLKEGEFGVNWIPALAIGVSDPVTGTTDYIDIEQVAGRGNGYFNRKYLALSKHFSTTFGQIGIHLGYQFNRRLDYSINGPCAGMNWQPVWLKQKGVLDNLNLIAEYDSRTVNIGVIASFWQNHIEAMFELQDFRWINFGLRYKLRIKRVVAA